MAGSKINDYGIGDSNIQSVMLTLDKAFKGQHQVSLTNYNNTSESQIAAGSVVECNGAQYQFTSNESITGSPSDGTVYIRLVPNGDTITAEYTATAPTWSDSKQGWYGTGGDANKRYLEFELTLKSTNWTKTVFNIYRKLSKRQTYIYLSKTFTTGITTKTKIGFSSEIDLLNEWDNSARRFTAKNSGYYNISGKYGSNIASSGTGACGILFDKNGVQNIITSFSGSHYASYGFDIFLDAGDYIEFFYSASVTTSVGFLGESLSIQYKNI